MEVTICVATYGGVEWVNLAHQRAIPSAEVEGVRVLHRHGRTLAQARNQALRLVETEFVIFCDADDELEEGYVQAMRIGKGDLRAPSVRFDDEAPRMPHVAGHFHDCTGPCLEDGNWIVIGACVRAQLLRDVGGFGEWPIWEDWAAWLACYRAGAVVEANPWAVYHAHRREGSRNTPPDAAERARLHREIAA